MNMNIITMKSLASVYESVQQISDAKRSETLARLASDPMGARADMLREQAIRTLNLLDASARRHEK